ERGLAKAEHRDLDRGLRLREARVLEMRHRDHVVALALGFDRVAHEVVADAVLGERVRRRRRRRRGVEGEGELRVENALEVRLDLRNVGRHELAVGRTLEPDLVLAHWLSTSARTRSGLPLPWRILSGAATTTAPVGGSWSRLVRHCRP